MLDENDNNGEMKYDKKRFQDIEKLKSCFFLSFLVNWELYCHFEIFFLTVKIHIISQKLWLLRSHCYSQPTSPPHSPDIKRNAKMINKIHRSIAEIRSHLERAFFCVVWRVRKIGQHHTKTGDLRISHWCQEWTKNVSHAYSCGTLYYFIWLKEQ